MMYMDKSKLYDILSEVRPDVAFEQEEGLIDNGLLTSFDLISIISEINEAYEITIKMVDILPENFNSVEAMTRLIEKYLNE